MNKHNITIKLAFVVLFFFLSSPRRRGSTPISLTVWIPAFAGMTRGLMMFFVLTLACFPNGADAHTAKSKNATSAQSPENDVSATLLDFVSESYAQGIAPVFEHKCFNCHSDQTVYPWYYKIPGIKQMIDSDVREGREHMDMGEGFPFKAHAEHGTVTEQLESVIESMMEETMPPSAYRWLHPDHVLSTQEKDLILFWAKQSLELLK